MRFYDYKCRACGGKRTELATDLCLTCQCGGLFKRDYSSTHISTAIFHGHFNHSVGRYVSSDADFRSALSEASDKESARTGVDHSYKPIDPRELKSQVSQEVLETKPHG